MSFIGYAEADQIITTIKEGISTEVTKYLILKLAQEKNIMTPIVLSTADIQESIGKIARRTSRKLTEKGQDINLTNLNEFIEEFIVSYLDNCAHEVLEQAYAYAETECVQERGRLQTAIRQFPYTT